MSPTTGFDSFRLPFLEDESTPYNQALLQPDDFLKAITGTDPYAATPDAYATPMPSYDTATDPYFQAGQAAAPSPLDTIPYGEQAAPQAPQLQQVAPQLPDYSNPERDQRLKDVMDEIAKLNKTQAERLTASHHKTPVTGEQALAATVASLLPLVLGYAAAQKKGAAMGATAGAGIAQSYLGKIEADNKEKQAEALALYKEGVIDEKDLQLQLRELQKQGYEKEDAYNLERMRQGGLDSRAAEAARRAKELKGEPSYTDLHRISPLAVEAEREKNRQAAAQTKFGQDITLSGIKEAQTKEADTAKSQQTLAGQIAVKASPSYEDLHPKEKAAPDHSNVTDVTLLKAAEPIKIARQIDSHANDLDQVIRANPEYAKIPIKDLYARLPTGSPLKQTLMALHLDALQGAKISEGRINEYTAKSYADYLDTGSAESISALQQRVREMQKSYVEQFKTEVDALKAGGRDTKGLEGLLSTLQEGSAPATGGGNTGIKSRADELYEQLKAQKLREKAGQ